MYLRTVKVRGSTGVTHEYLRLIESYWEDGQAKQRIVANLGRKDLLAPHLDALVRVLGGARAATAPTLQAEAVQAEQAACWGPMLVARTLWRELGLEAILDACEGRRRRAATLPLADRALVLVTQRLCDPQSEHRLAAWLETDFVCDRRGRRLLPQWKTQGRVRVDLTWLQRWYRTL